MQLLKMIKKKIRQGGLFYALNIVVKRTGESAFLFFSRCLFSGCKTDNIIAIESHNDFDCNGGAFYNYLLSKEANKKWKIVWLVRNPLKTGLPENVYAFNFWSKGLKKEYYLNKAKYLVCDDKFIKKRRKSQIEVYCQHGLSLKNVKGRIVVPQYVDYVLSSSEYYDQYLCENISVPYGSNKILHFGYPYNDVLFADIDDESKKITEKKFSKKVLWMPTFRKKNIYRNDSDEDLPLGIPLIKSINELETLNEILRKKDCLLIIKIHPMQIKETYAKLRSMSNVAVLDGERVKELNVDNYRLMKACDAMISDYSSAAYSFLLLDRPIGFVLSDLEHYKLGFSVENYEDFLPGEKIYTQDDFISFINNLYSGTDGFTEDRQKLIKKLFKYYDGNASARLAEFLNI